MVMRMPIKHLYEFGNFALDVSERLLTCEGKVVPLAPKVFDTLQVLVENNGHLLEKEILLERLWPDTIVEESNLTTYISSCEKHWEKMEIASLISKPSRAVVIVSSQRSEKSLPLSTKFQRTKYKRQI